MVVENGDHGNIMDQADFQQSNVTHHLIEKALKDTLAIRLNHPP